MGPVLPLIASSEEPQAQATFQSRNGAGHGARADLDFRLREGRTILSHGRATAPLRVAPPVDLGGCAYTTLVNITGGVAAGDAFDHEIAVGDGAHALITTQSATKVYRSNGAIARAAATIAVGTGATIEWVPDAVIPFAGARYEQSLIVDIASGGAAIAADAWACGRVARAERWAAWLAGTCRIDLCGTTVYVDRFGIDPGSARVFEGWPYVASWIAAADRTVDWERLAARLAEILEAGEPAVYGGGSTICRGGVAARFVAATAPALTEVSNALWSELRQALLGLPRPHLRKY